MTSYYTYYLFTVLTALVIISIITFLFYKLKLAVSFFVNFLISMIITASDFLITSGNSNLDTASMIRDLALLMAPIIYAASIRRHFHYTRDEKTVSILSLSSLSIIIYLIIPSSAVNIIAISHMYMYLFITLSIKTNMNKPYQLYFQAIHLALGVSQLGAILTGHTEITAFSFLCAGLILITSVSYFNKQRISRVLDQCTNISEQNKKLSHTISRLKMSNEQFRKILMEKESELYQLSRHASLAELTTGIAHELTQPITGIKLISQNMIDDINYDEFDKLQAVSELVKICSLVDKSTSIINHIRTFSKKAISTMKPTDINKILLEAIDLINLQVKKNNINLVYVLDDSIPKILGDKISLEQLIVNIILNAKDAIIKKRESNSDHDGIIQITTTRGDSGIKVIIEDNGIGIPVNMIQKIWSPFYTTKKGDLGTGIGLSISSKILKEHRGSVEVQSDTSGTIFTFLFPVAPLSFETIS